MPIKLFEGDTVPVSVDTVIDVVRMLDAAKQSEAFKQYCKEKRIILNISADAVNALKQFLDERRVDTPMAASIIGLDPDGCQNYQCPHIHN